jgi:threonine aldolase
MTISKVLIDLRSDTVTKPTPEMRRAMAEAPVGDDVYGEDPTVRRLEEMAAGTLGFEVSLFVPSGTMGNQIALAVHARPGEEVVCDSQSHIIHYEMGAMAALSGLLPRVLEVQNVFPTADQVEEAIAPDLPYVSRTGVVSLENSHNMGGGAVMPVAWQREILEVTRRKGVPVHLDGARIFNAAVALGVEARQIAEGCDSVMFCISKGLGAPVGSLLCGSTDFVKEARRVRKRFGGGMRQVGILAAAGVVALEKMTSRLTEDHRIARLIGEGLASVPGISIPVQPQTNILIFQVGPEWFRGSVPADGDYAGPLVRRLAEHGILALALGARRVRLVTHFDLPPESVERTLEAADRGR